MPWKGFKWGKARWNGGYIGESSSSTFTAQAPILPSISGWCYHSCSVWIKQGRERIWSALFSNCWITKWSECLMGWEREKGRNPSLGEEAAAVVVPQTKGRGPCIFMRCFLPSLRSRTECHSSWVSIPQGASKHPRLTDLQAWLSPCYEFSDAARVIVYLGIFCHTPHSRGACPPSESSGAWWGWRNPQTVSHTLDSCKASHQHGSSDAQSDIRAGWSTSRTRHTGIASHLCVSAHDQPALMATETLSHTGYISTR